MSGIVFGNNANASDTHPSHPYVNFPRRFKRIFNNFMMSKTGSELADSMNWSADMRSYGMHKVFEDAGMQLPSFSMAKEVYVNYGYVQE
jgi:hypothetical protein